MATSAGRILTTLDGNGVRPRHRLADDTGLTRATVTTTVRTLIDAGLVREMERGEASRRGGPRPIALAVVPDALGFVGLDIRREKFTACLVDLGGTMTAAVSEAVPVDVDTDAALATIDRLVAALVRPGGLPLAAIGIGSVGPIAHDRVIRSRSFTALNDLDIVDRLGERHGIPVALRTGAVVGAYGEERIARAQGVPAKSVAFAVIDYGGVGLGLVSGGAGWITDHGGVGELGHVVVERNGRPCACGRRGCLLQYASGAAIVEALGHAAGPRPTMAEVARRADAGDAAAVAALVAAGEHLGTALTDMDRILRPERIALASSHDGIARWFRRGVMNYVGTLPDTEGERPLPERIVVAELGGAAIAYGAAAMQLKNTLADPEAAVAARRRDEGGRWGRPGAAGQRNATTETGGP